MSFFGQIQLAFVFFLFYFLTRETTQSERKYYFFFNSVSYYFFLVSRDGSVFVCFLGAFLYVCLCCKMLLLLQKMYVLFMNVA